jgi:hypothetical protein
MKCKEYLEKKKKENTASKGSQFSFENEKKHFDVG